MSNVASLNFAEKFYRRFAVGLSLDEALTYTRLLCHAAWSLLSSVRLGPIHGLSPNGFRRAVFPDPERTAMRERQNEVRAGRKQTVGAMTKQLDGEGVQQMPVRGRQPQHASGPLSPHSNP